MGWVPEGKRRWWAEAHPTPKDRRLINAPGEFVDLPFLGPAY